MSATNYDSRTADKFAVRLPDGLRAEIEAAASADDRSMNSVFVKAVRQYLDGQNRQALLLDALEDAAQSTTEKSSVVADPTYSDARIQNIDLWIKTLENAKRYEWLRDVAFDTPRQDLVPRDKSGNMLIEQDLDSEIDCAMHAYPAEQEVEHEQAQTV